MKAALVCLAVALSALAATAAPARACSCASPDPRTWLPRADGAIVGRLVERRVENGQARHRFRVFQAVKGRFGRYADVWSNADGAACGLEVRVGTVTGLLLDRRRGRWESSLCAQVDPARLRAAARSLARPDGRGPAAFLVGSRTGDVRSIALDTRGRTLGYGRGSGSVLAFGACPGGRRAVELVGATRPYLAVRALPRMRLLARRALPSADPIGSVAADLRCLSRDAGRVAVFLGDLNGRGRGSRLLLSRPDGTRIVWRGTALYGAVGRRTAALAAGPAGARMIRVSLATGRFVPVARTAPTVSGVWLRPDGRVVAAVSRAWLTVVRLDGGAPRVVRVRAPYGGGRVVWLPHGRLALYAAGGPPRILDERLRRVGSIAGWSGPFAAARGARLVGVDYEGRLVELPPRGGAAHVVRALPATTTTAFAAVS